MSLILQAEIEIRLLILEYGEEAVKEALYKCLGVTDTEATE